ncbi:transposon TX1 [Tanacetum coccineum]
MGKLWMIFKKYGTVFDMFMVQRRLRNGKIYGFVRYKFVRDVEGLLGQLQGIQFGEEWLRVFVAYDRRRNNDGAVGTDGVVHENRVKKMNNGGVKENREIAFNRDDKRFVDVVNCVNARPTKNHIDKEAKEEGTILCNRKIEVNGENEVNVELMMRSMVGEVKARGFLMKLPVLCEEQGLNNFEVKLLGGLECVCEDMLKDAYFGAKTKTFEDYSILTNTPYPGKEILRISANSSQENAYKQFSIRSIPLLPYTVSIKITIQRYEDIYILGMNIILIINFARTPRDTPQYAVLA